MKIHKQIATTPSIARQQVRADKTAFTLIGLLVVSQNLNKKTQTLNDNSRAGG